MWVLYEVIRQRSQQSGMQGRGDLTSQGWEKKKRQKEKGADMLGSKNSLSEVLEIRESPVAFKSHRQPIGLELGWAKVGDSHPLDC